MYHVKSWGVWLVAALTPFLLTKNPFYLLLAILVVGVDYWACNRIGAREQQWGLLLRLGIAFAALSVVFNILFVSVGATRLVTLPAWRLGLGQTAIQIGGAITLESLVYGLAQALGMFGILIVLAIFNRGVDHYELLRSAPRFLHQSALVLSIAVTFVPQMLIAQAEIREAQILRGHRFGALRDLPPLFVALLAEGLERSITLAESMSARGFGGQLERAPRATILLRVLIALALSALIAGAVALNFLAEKIVGVLPLAVGCGMLLAVLWSINQSVQCSRYHCARWHLRDSILVGMSLSALAVFLGAWIADRTALSFYPYPRFVLPTFRPLVAAAILLLGAPAIAKLRNKVSVDD
ncbi:MAG: energy-coupling factor transporter transmembrane component T [Chloroflexota bacterium]